MNKATWVLLSTAILAAAANGCGPIKIPLTDTQVLPISTVPSSKGRVVTQVEDLDLAVKTGSSDLPPLAKHVYINVIAVRSVTEDEADRTEDARKNDDLILKCPGDRAGLGFIESAVLSIKHQGEPDSAAIPVANYRRVSDEFNPCGFYMEIIPDVDIKDYVGDYAMVARARGLPPMGKVEVSGYIELVVKEGIL